MRKTVKKRVYNSTNRRQAAETTRQSILEAAREIFLSRGYAAATMPAIALAAGIALDTVYATVGKKPALFRLLVETALSGTNSPVPGEERNYVKEIREETDPRRKLELYAAAITEIQPRLAPLVSVLQAAAPLDPELDALWNSISERRARNMMLFAEDLASTGKLRQSLSLQKAADILWSMNSPEFYLLLVHQRKWTASEFQAWLAEIWVTLLVEP